MKVGCHHRNTIASHFEPTQKRRKCVFFTRYGFFATNSMQNEVVVSSYCIPMIIYCSTTCSHDYDSRMSSQEHNCILFWPDSKLTKVCFFHEIRFFRDKQHAKRGSRQLLLHFNDHLLLNNMLTWLWQSDVITGTQLHLILTRLKTDESEFFSRDTVFSRHTACKTR